MLALRRLLTVIPGIGAALLPNITCPACWPAYAGILAAAGLGFVMKGPYFLIIISVLIGASLFSLAYRARIRRGYKPFILGSMAGIIIFFGKLISASDYVLYTGAGILIMASIWNNWPLKKHEVRVNTSGRSACPDCEV